MKYRENHPHAQTLAESDPPPHLHSHILNHTDKSPTAAHRLNAPHPPAEAPTALLHWESRSQRSTRLSRTLCVLTKPCRPHQHVLSLLCSLVQLERDLHEIYILSWDTTQKKVQFPTESQNDWFHTALRKELAANLKSLITRHSPVN